MAIQEHPALGLPPRHQSQSSLAVQPLDPRRSQRARIGSRGAGGNPNRSKKPKAFRQRQSDTRREGIAGKLVAGVAQGEVPRVRHEPRDFELFSPDSADDWIDPRDFLDSTSSLHVSAPSLFGGDHQSVASGWKPDGAFDFGTGRNSDLDGVGSWSDWDTVRGSYGNELFREDDMEDSWLSAAPFQPRDAAPDLASLFQRCDFRPCCEDDPDKVNESHYLSGRAKMDSQLTDAQAYIAKQRSQKSKGL